MRPEHPVVFVGAGPGAADLLTIRAARAIEAADVILHDSLVSDEVLELARPACRLFDVGKRGDVAAFPQSSTNAMMAHYARAGLRVVRLKGGDPSLFARLEEERSYLETRAIATQTIAGVTAASAAAAQFAFSLTERGGARGVHFLTGRIEGGAVATPGAAALAEAQTTLVFYMAAHVVDAVQSAALGAGRAPDTPVLLVENAGHACARAVRGRLDDLARLVAQARCTGPSLVLIGAVAAHARAADFACAEDVALSGAPCGAPSKEDALALCASAYAGHT